MKNQPFYKKVIFALFGIGLPIVIAELLYIFGVDLKVIVTATAFLAYTLGQTLTHLN
jgi:hypothetical protein